MSDDCDTPFSRGLEREIEKLRAELTTAKAENERYREALQAAYVGRCCQERGCHRPEDFDVDAHNAAIDAALVPAPPAASATPVEDDTHTCSNECGFCNGNPTAKTCEAAVPFSEGDACGNAMPCAVHDGTPPADDTKSYGISSSHPTHTDLMVTPESIECTCSKAGCVLHDVGPCSLCGKLFAECACTAEQKTQAWRDWFKANFTPEEAAALTQHHIDEDDK